MIIDLKAIPQEGIRSFEFCLDEDWWKSDDQNYQVLGLSTPFTVKIVIYRAGDKFVLEGDLTGGLQVKCDRCLEVYNRDVRSEFRLFLALPSMDIDKAEIELLDEDMEVGFTKGEEVDLDEIIKEQIYLSLPIKLLCKENCLGLCPTCGCNLNEKECKCEKDHGHPGFSKLKSLKIEGE